MWTNNAALARARLAARFMIGFRIILLLASLLGIPAVVRADDFWKHKPAAQWSRAEALRLVRRSPWAKLEILPLSKRETEAAFSVPTGVMHCDTDAIDKNGNCLQKGRIEEPIDSSRQIDAAPIITPSVGMLVRWESAGPVAQAFARLEELGEHAAALFQAPAPRLPPDRYVITVKLEQPGRNAFQPFTITPKGNPVLLATLKTRRGTVSPLEVVFTGVGATSAVHFFFPRTLDSTPLLATAHDSAEFTLLGAGFAVRSKFTLDPEYLR